LRPAVWAYRRFGAVWPSPDGGRRTALLVEVSYVLPSFAIGVLEYLDREGKSPWAGWFESQVAQTASSGLRLLGVS